MSASPPAPPPEPPLPEAALLARIPLGAGPVVLAGCGAAAIAAALRRRDPAARLVGTEADPALAAEAARLLDEVHPLPPGTPPPLPPGSAACLVLPAAALRPDPAAALARFAALLAPGGVLLAAAPNGARWTLARALLAGEEPPAAGFPLGFEGMRAALAAAGLVPLEALPEAPDAAEAQDFARRIAPALAAMGNTEETFLRRAGPARILWRATRGRVAPLVVVAQVLKPVGGVNDVRVDLPLGALATRPGVTIRLTQSAELPQVAEGTPRILLLQRRLLDTPQAPAFVQQYRRRGWVVVQEFDDDPDHWPVIGASGHFAFRGVHAVQTSTPALAALLGQWNEEVAVFPNTVAELPEPQNFRDPDRLTLFLGALRREEDTAPFIAPLNRVLAAAKGRLAVDVVYDRATFDRLQTPHKAFAPLLPYAAYRARMARCDLAFLPLAPTRFNGFKSDLKFVEAGAHRLCVIASPTVYAGTIRPQETGLVVDNPSRFETALTRLLAEPARARAMGDAARDWVRANRLLAGHVQARLDWYRSLWDRRAELDAALLRRAPEFAGLA